VTWRQPKPSYPQHYRFDRVHTRARGHRQSHVLSVGYRLCAPGAKHTATGFYNLVISTNRCERNHGYVKSRLRPMRGLKSLVCATRLFSALDALQLVERDFVRVPSVAVPCTGGRSYVRARRVASIVTQLGHHL
jgi:hypothetical protein